MARGDLPCRPLSAGQEGCARLYRIVSRQQPVHRRDPGRGGLDEPIGGREGVSASELYTGDNVGIPMRGGYGDEGLWAASPRAETLQPVCRFARRLSGVVSLPSSVRRIPALRAEEHPTPPRARPLQAGERVVRAGGD